MRLRPEQLPAQLGKALLPAWLVCGDEPLIVLESADRIRAAARAAGCSERDVFHADAGFDWNRLRESAGSMSLFGDKRLVELRLDRVPSPDGQQAIADWCERAGDDTVLLVIAGALEKKQLDAAWVRALDQTGAVIQAWPVPRSELPAWMRLRLQAQGVEADGAALEFLADRVEGNLLAAQQEIDRIALLFGKGAIDAEKLAAVVADSARYELEGALDAALAGHGARALRMLEGLREEGESTVPLLWMVQRDVRGLLLAAELVAQGRNEQGALQAAGVWGNRQQALAPALKRLRVPALKALLADCAKAEKTNKGQAPGSSWDAMATLLLRIAGQKAPPGTGREIV
ncbi:MAG: DNA polymerase III subunit delta [Pseudomonadota bacterium]